MELPIVIEGVGTNKKFGRSKTAGRRLKGNKEIEFDDDIGNGFDLNAGFKIVSTSPGVSAKFSDDGTKSFTKGNGEYYFKI